MQPRAGQELVVQRISTAEDDKEGVLPSLLALDEDSSVRTVLSIDAFEARLERSVRGRTVRCSIFDQFEEIVTLFDAAGLRGVPAAGLIELFVRLLHEFAARQAALLLPRGLPRQGQGAAGGLP